MTPTAFASARPLHPAEMAQRPIRYPRPASWLGECPAAPGPRRRPRPSGLQTVGDLLLHLPA